MILMYSAFYVNKRRLMRVVCSAVVIPEEVATSRK